MVEARAPGRVNLIGEHTDYNGGFVMPCAIPYDTHVRAAQRDDGKVVIDAPHADSRTAAYVNGMLEELKDAAVSVRGMDLRIDGTLPIGAGLSSSASLEISVALAALALGGVEMDLIELARRAQRAENLHVGIRSGIMDQFTVLFARKGCALFLDTRTLDYELLAVPAGLSIVICNTMVKHELAAGEYNVRREQCEACVDILARDYPGVRQLRDVAESELEAARTMLSPVLFKRAKHVVDENARVLEARKALQTHDDVRFGELMNASHESLRYLYEVSSPELDVMVELAREGPGIYGARMTGGGFGGCTVNLVDAKRADDFRSYIVDAYAQHVGVAPEVYDGTPSDRARVL